MNIHINEVFGPTVQGEGLDIGRPCVFIRTHGCPVNCPGCDTAYTWDGSEKGIKLQILSSKPNSLEYAADDASLEAKVWRILNHYRDEEGACGCGVVVTGGEPLLHYRNEAFRTYLNMLKSVVTFVSLETSGFVGTNFIDSKGVVGSEITNLDRFMGCFTSVHLSPKVTPCLHGVGWDDSDLTMNIPSILNACFLNGVPIALKFVARDSADIDAIDEFMRSTTFHPFKRGQVPVFVMPYGQERDEVAECIESLIPFAAKRGWIITPRLQCLLWGKKRAV